MDPVFFICGEKSVMYIKPYTHAGYILFIVLQLRWMSVVYRELLSVIYFLVKCFFHTTNHENWKKCKSISVKERGFSNNKEGILLTTHTVIIDYVHHHMTHALNQ